MIKHRKVWWIKWKLNENEERIKQLPIKERLLNKKNTHKSAILMIQREKVKNRANFIKYRIPSLSFLRSILEKYLELNFLRVSNSLWNLETQLYTLFYIDFWRNHFLSDKIKNHTKDSKTRLKLNFFLCIWGSFLVNVLEN